MPKPDLSYLRQIVNDVDLHTLKRMNKIISTAINDREKNNISELSHEHGSFNLASNHSPKNRFHKLLSKDWSNLFSSQKCPAKNHYVYLHVDPRSAFTTFKMDSRVISFRHPFYVGVGQGGRIYEKIKRSRMHARQIKEYLSLGYVEKEIMVYFETGLTEQNARELEAKLILFFGITSAFSQRTVKKRHVALSGKPPSLLNKQYEPIAEEFKQFAYEGCTQDAFAKIAL